jgi:hypothetical protein
MKEIENLYVFPKVDGSSERQYRLDESCSGGCVGSIRGSLKDGYKVLDQKGELLAEVYGVPVLVQYREVNS